MTVSSLVDVIHGRLLNDPAINRVEAIRIDARKVRRGDCFFAFFDEDIDLALANGAYAVVLTRPRDAMDDETAWIQVEAIQDAILLLLRYLLSSRDIRFFHAKEPLFALAKACLGKNRAVAMLADTAYGLMETLLENDQITHCIGREGKILGMLSADVGELTPLEAEEQEHSLFETRLSGFAPLPLASRLAPELFGLLTWCQDEKLDNHCDISGEEGLFYACYLTRENRFSSKPTARVAIIDYPFSDDYIEASLAYIDENFRWGKKRIIRQSEWNDAQMLWELLEKDRFDFVYLECREPSEVLGLLKSPRPGSGESTLF